jgi:hypothetical protein
LKTKAIVDEISRFYRAQDQTDGTHLALRWKGRVRYTVPREWAGQNACWKLFKPGMLAFPMRAKAAMPGLLGSVACVESDNLAVIRDAIRTEAGLSSCRAGSPGPWSKETILLLNKNTAQPLYLVKAGAGQAVDALLRNEADWLETLRNEPSLAGHIPELVAHRSGADLCFVAQHAVAGNLDFRLGAAQLDFLCKLQSASVHSMRFEDSKLYRTLNSRLTDLEGHLTEAWSERLKKAMLKITEAFSDKPLLVVAAHNDFTPWNIRIEDGQALVFDWEHAANEQLPLFDPLHFTLLPMALKSLTTENIVQRMHETMQLCHERFGRELCSEALAQALAYLVNISTLYLWSARGNCDSDLVVRSYAHVIDGLFSRMESAR